MERALARHLHPSSFPADRDVLVAEAQIAFAPTAVVERLRHLPDRRYDDADEVAEAARDERDAAHS